MIKVIKVASLLSIFLLLTACNLGGVVTGLDGTLTIEEENSGESLIINKSGAFTFNHSFENGDPYSVSITQQPSDTSLLCTISDGSGNYSRSAKVHISCEPQSFCTTQYEPVCALESTPIQCITTPCEPQVLHKTYNNACLSNLAGAEVVFQGVCGDKEGEPELPATNCTEEYSPVCAIEITPIVCITTPCLPLRHYQSYSNTCYANHAGSEIILNEACGELENLAVRSITVSDLSTIRLPKGDFLTINRIDEPVDDILTLSVTYMGGCSNHEFSLYGDRQLSTNWMVRGDAILLHNANDDACETLITEDIHFELSPWKNHYHNTINMQSGTIEMQITAPGSVIDESSEVAVEYMRDYTFGPE